MRAALARCPGDVVVLGAGGKMGPSLARMLRRASAQETPARTIHAVSRWTDSSLAARLERDGVSTVRADLADPDIWRTLPAAPNVFFLAGQKFGTSAAPWRTWMTNVVVPAYAAERYSGARLVAFSTGNVYPFLPIDSSGARETDPLAPVGEYAMSCVGRERVFEHAAARLGSAVAVIRLNYAVDLRYGVLVDIATRVHDRQPVPLTVPVANVIWQGDANAVAIRSLPYASSEPFVVNVTGPDVVRVRDAAEYFGARFGIPVEFTGEEGAEALLSNTARAQQLFGAPAVGTAQLLDWVASWVQRGGSRLAKPTHFEERGGRF